MIARPTSPARMVAALAITQTAGYGVLYYAFSVFIPPMSRDLRAGVAELTGAITLSVLVSGLVAPVVGRRLDRHGGRGLMTTGSLLGALSVLAWSQVRSVAELYVVCGVLGVASAMVLYEAAFAVIVAWFDAARRARALLAVTVVAGFASSVFLPLTGVLVELYGWRRALVILAAGYAVTAVPLHALVVRGRAAPPHADRREIVRTAVRERPFWLLAAAFLTQTGAVAVMGVLLVTYLITLGHPPVFAAGVAGLLGVLSVTGRLVTTGLQARWPVALVTAAMFALQGLAAVLLPLVGRDTVGAVVGVVLFGLGFGVATIARPALMADRYGTAAYASLSGALALPITVAKAVAPLLAAGLAQVTGYPAVMGAVAAACALGALALVAYERDGRSRDRAGELSGHPGQGRSVGEGEHTGGSGRSAGDGRPGSGPPTGGGGRCGGEERSGVDLPAGDGERPSGGGRAGGGASPDDRGRAGGGSCPDDRERAGGGACPGDGQRAGGDAGSDLGRRPGDGGGRTEGASA
ncbi:MFS transporter [Nonomuraea terrae]|uniref:MFS transporter n=1 Tax=Nonomuraea terrae TaxID=2530383 RepID=UPI00379D9DCF